MGITQTMSCNIPLSLYIHIPWCVKKCPYCDFNSHQTERIPEQFYVSALIDDLTQDVALAQGRAITSIFFGGGTPSLFHADSIHRILDGVKTQVNVKPDCEITLEVNPGTAEYSNLKLLSATGVNRLSFGVQSFHDSQLNALGRIHSGAQAHEAFNKAREAGFDNINLDLMHGLPGQTPASAEQDLRHAIVLKPEHISWYQLTIEPNTVFYKNPPKLPVEDTLIDIYENGLSLLQANEYHQYEVSAFAKNGKQAAHNLNYWQFGDYLAIGAGAHGKVTQANGEILRYWKTRKPNDYLASNTPFTAGRKFVPAQEQMFEFLMNALRLKNGVPTSTFVERTQLGSHELQSALAPLQSQGLIASSDNCLRTTKLGFQFLNTVLEHLA